MCYTFRCKACLYKLVAAWMKILFNFPTSFLLECSSMSLLSLLVGRCDLWWRWYLDTSWHSQGFDCTYSCRVSLDLEEIDVTVTFKVLCGFSLQSSRYKCQSSNPSGIFWSFRWSFHKRLMITFPRKWLWHHDICTYLLHRQIFVCHLNL